RRDGRGGASCPSLRKVVGSPDSGQSGRWMPHVPDLRSDARMNGQTADVPDEAADPYVESLLRASRALMSITARSLSSVNDEVTLPQFRSLVVLSTAGPQTVSAPAGRRARHPA